MPSPALAPSFWGWGNHRASVGLLLLPCNRRKQRAPWKAVVGHRHGGNRIVMGPCLIGREGDGDGVVTKDRARPKREVAGGWPREVIELQCRTGFSVS